MNGIKGLFDSKKAFFTLLFFVACCAGWLTGKMTTDQWAQFSLIALGGYFAAETTNAIAVGKAAAKAAPKSLGGYTVEVEADTSKAEAAMESLTAKAKEASEAVAKATEAADPNSPVLS